MLRNAAVIDITNSVFKFFAFSANAPVEERVKVF